MKLENFDFSKKIFYHPEKIHQFKLGQRPFPTTVEVDLTNNCNHRCSFCFYGEHIGRGKMPTLETNLIKTRLVEMKEMGAKGISFTGGGESMLHPNFIEILQHTKDTGFDVGLITNGSAITKEKIKALLKNLSWIRVSMAGGDAESYKAVQGVDQFEKVIKNVGELSSEKFISKSSLNIGIRILVTPKNIKSLNNLKSALKDTNLNYVQIAPDQFTKDEGKFWYSNESQSIFKSLETSLNSMKIKLLTSNYVWGQENIQIPRTCYAHFFQLCLCAEGDLMYCKNARGEKKFIIGNIYNNTIKEIWNSKTNKDLESWVKPSNCGLYCKHIHMNVALEKFIHPQPDDSANFVG